MRELVRDEGPRSSSSQVRLIRERSRLVPQDHRFTVHTSDPTRDHPEEDPKRRVVEGSAQRVGTLSGS